MDKINNIEGFSPSETDSRGVSFRPFTGLAFLAAVAPVLVAGPLARVADGVEHVAQGGSLAQSDFDIPHPRVMRSLIVASAVMAKYQEEGASVGNFIDGYVDFTRVRFFDSRLGACLPDEVANQWSGAAMWGVNDRAACLAPIIGTDEQTLREAE